MVHEEGAKVQMYGSGFYNWFNGNQSALFTATGSTGNSFLINVHGTSNVLVGDITIPAYTPGKSVFVGVYAVCVIAAARSLRSPPLQMNATVEEEWFCDGFTAMLSSAGDGSHSM